MSENGTQNAMNKVMVEVKLDDHIFHTTSTEEDWPDCFEVVVESLRREQVSQVIDALREKYKVELDAQAEHFLETGRLIYDDWRAVGQGSDTKGEGTRSTDER